MKSITSLLLLCSLLAGSPTAQTPAPRADLLDRVVVMGASVSAGFGLCKDLEVATPLADLWNAALVDEPRPALDLGQNLFFLNPVFTGARLAQTAAEAQPSLVIAVDFLFWYGMSFRWYGEESQRLVGLELGLKELEKLDCPLVIGDFPDVRRALHGTYEVTGRPVIFRSMIPEEETRAAMNERVRAWAAERPNVVLIPLAQILEDMATGQPMVLPGGQQLVGTPEEILQQDLLHPRLPATEGLVLKVLDALRESGLGLDPGRVFWSLEEVHAALMKDLAPRLAQYEESQARRRRALGG
ncbi:MAG: hypothetical protein R3F33_05250 [Planctomycetota bacterium]